LGGQKRGFAPHLNYWGARARAAPPESTPMAMGNASDFIFLALAYDVDRMRTGIVLVV